MPIMNLAEEIARYLPSGEGERGGVSTALGLGAGAAAVGGILGGVFGGDD
jgi:hypothetical protein